MTDEPMTLVDRLLNPQWVHSNTSFEPPQLDIEQTRKDMQEAAGRICQLETAIFRYLAGDYSCNGGAEQLLSEAVGKSQRGHRT